MPETTPSPVRRAITICAIVLLFIVGALLFWQMRGLLLVMFAGILLAILLDGAARWLLRVTGLPRSAGVIASVLAVIAVIGAAAAFLGPGLAEQATQLVDDLTRFVTTIEKRTMAIDAVEEQVDKGSVDLMKVLPSPGGLLGGVSAVLGATLGAFANLLLIAVFAIYFALDPHVYSRGVRKLLPPRHREPAKVLMDDMGDTLRHWLAGKTILMLVLGIASYVALSLMGVPLAMLLAVIAGLTSFIPIIGPAIAGGLMILVAMTVSMNLALWAGAFYLLLQTAESYLLMPMIQGRAIDLPASLLIASQVVFGTLFGVLGVALATPITAVLAVAIKQLYIDDLLEDEAAAA